MYIYALYTANKAKYTPPKVENRFLLFVYHLLGEVEFEFISS